MDQNIAAPAAQINRRFLRTVGLKPKTLRLLKRKNRAPAAWELKRIPKMELQQILKQNGQTMKTCWNKSRLSEVVCLFLANVDRINAPPPVEAAPAEQPTCFVCRNDQPEFYFIRCGHVGICGGCRDLLVGHHWDRRCPMCRLPHRLEQVQPLNML